MTTSHESGGRVRGAANPNNDQEREAFENLLDKYWALAHAEGREGRDYDTVAGDAQKALHDLMALWDARASMLKAAPEQIEEIAHRTAWRYSVEDGTYTFNRTTLLEFVRRVGAAPEVEGWKHDCAALCANNVELWVENCPHCGKPRCTAAPPAQTGWISVKDRLPEDGARVLYFFDLLGVFEGKHLGGGAFGGKCGFLNDEVTHWMPIPAPPTEVQSHG